MKVRCCRKLCTHTCDVPMIMIAVVLLLSTTSANGFYSHKSSSMTVQFTSRKINHCVYSVTDSTDKKDGDGNKVQQQSFTFKGSSLFLKKMMLPLNDASAGSSIISNANAHKHTHDDKMQRLGTDHNSAARHSEDDRHISDNSNSTSDSNVSLFGSGSSTSSVTISSNGNDDRIYSYEAANKEMVEAGNKISSSEKEYELYTSPLQLSLELIQLKSRLDKVEKSIMLSPVSSVGSSPSSKNIGRLTGTMGSIIDSLSFNTISLNAKTVEVCATASFFIIGSILGASLLDRLWLVGGIALAYWASGAVYRDTRGGSMARRIGVQVAQFVKDLQEKYNQAIIFYKTGKLGFYSMGIWDRYDSQFGITQKFDTYKKLAMKRSIDFNTAFKDARVSDQINDLWRVIQQAPVQAKQYDREYKISSSVKSAAKGVLSTAKGYVSTAKQGIKSWIPRSSNDRPSSSYSRGSGSVNGNGNSDSILKALFSNGDNNDGSNGDDDARGIFSFRMNRSAVSRKKVNVFDIINDIGDAIRLNDKDRYSNYRGRNINPWAPFYSSKQSVEKRRNRNRQRNRSRRDNDASNGFATFFDDLRSWF